MTQSILRLAAVAVLGLVLAGPARPAAVASAWDWLQALWSGSDHGCNIDPNGNPRCAPISAQGDHGCNIDPDGKPRCAP